MENETPRTKERRSVAQKRLNYLSRESPLKTNETDEPEVTTIPRYSPDSLVEINLETFRTDAADQTVDLEVVDVKTSFDSCATYTIESVEERLQDCVTNPYTYVT